MKAFIRLSCIVVSLVITTTVFAQSASVTAVNANLRGTPSNNGKVVQRVSNGTVLEVIQQKGAWYLVQSAEYVGWIHGNTIRLNDDTDTNGGDSGVILVPVPGSGSGGGYKSSREPNVDRFGELKIGMSGSQIKSIVGEPESMNRTTSAFGITEQWAYEIRVFRSTQYGPTFDTKRAYVYLTNGRVSSLSN